MIAFSLDSSMFSRNSYDLSSGKLALIAKRPRETRVILCDLVIKEVKKNWTKHAIDVLDTINKKTSTPSASFLHDVKPIPIPKREEIDAKIEDHLRSFLTRSGVEIIPVAPEALHAAVSKYETGQPPFDRDKKQDEFKDALILFSLEAWAKANKCKVTLASADGDWKSYCEKSDCLVFADDLAIALESAQTELKATKAMVDKYLFAARFSEDFGGWVSLVDSVKHFAGQAVPTIDAFAPCEIEWWYYDLDAKEARPARSNKEFVYRVLSASPTEVTIDLQFSVKCEISVTFDFTASDSIDGDPVHLNSRDLSKEVFARASCLVELQVEDGQVVDVSNYQEPRVDKIQANFGELWPYSEEEMFEE